MESNDAHAMLGEADTTSSSNRPCDMEEIVDGVCHDVNDNRASLDAAVTLNDDGWTLHIKRVGTQEADFSVALHPEDNLAQLYDAVSSVTGLPQEQQRLIYRGRLLPQVVQQIQDATLSPSLRKEGSPHESCGTKVKDIVGLTDGHTIHLVRKERAREEETEASPSATSSTTPATTPSSSGSATSTLLAALLGASNEERRNRRAPYRLREEDWVRPDPGSMAPVQQGLLTLHTISSADNRRFYLGQWIDCRDTVNQWLEATVMAIVDPSDIVSREDHEAVVSPAAHTHAPTIDPVVPVTDLDGRRRLLFDPCEEAESEEQIDRVHYRRRDNDDSVQLLHIHYNGWPVRWDEWIRSDSERIRPFRTRTRHSGTQASPAVQTSTADAPSVSFVDEGDETANRLALLPELHRAVTTVHNLLDAAMASNSISMNGTAPAARRLPWLAAPEGDEPTNTLSSLQARRRDLEALAPFLDRLGRTLTDAAPHIAAMAACMGECDDDEDYDDDDDELESEEHPGTLGGLLSLLSRDRRRNEQSVASSTAANPNSDVSTSMASSTTGRDNTEVVDEEDEEEVTESVATAVLDPDHRDFVTGFVNTTRGDLRSGPRLGSSSRSGSDEITSLLGAYLAAASLGGLTSVGFGTEDGNGGSGNEGFTRLLRGNGGGGIDIHIHAVVTAPGLEGGIGIAALAGAGASLPPVATPVTPATGGANAAATFIPTGGLGSLFGSRDTSNRRGSRRFRTTASDVSQPFSSNDDDSGIFAELYSETPEPINPNSPASRSSSTSPPPQLQREWASQNDLASPMRPSRSRSRSNRIQLTSGSSASSVGGSVATSSANSTSQRNGGMLRRFFRRNSDHNE